MAWNKKGGQVRLINIEDIRPNPAQPRRQFDERALRELSQSIARYGVLQPLSVRRGESGFELIAGERRLRAARMAGLREVPCLETKVGEEDSACLALIENIQRQDLSFLEEAEAIDALIRRHGLSQEEAARRLGRSQGAVANKLRLLQLSPDCREILVQGGLTERHGRCALRLTEEKDRLEALALMARNGWTVRRSEEYIEGKLKDKKAPRPKGRKAYVLKDVRLFLNSVNRSVQLMRQSGVAADMEKQESEEEILLTIRIPRKKQEESVIKL